MEPTGTHHSHSTAKTIWKGLNPVDANASRQGQIKTHLVDTLLASYDPMAQSEIPSRAKVVVLRKHNGDRPV
jgi:hypothetical protein